MLRRCSKCILPETYPEIIFNEKGVCNYCLTYRRKRHRGEAELRKSIEPYRNSGREYDCIVALSGGRDSSFLAHYAVRTLGLRVLAYTWDNGFMPEQTKENIENIVDVLGIDHVVEKHDYVEKNERHIVSSWMRRPSPAMIGFLCTGCKTGYIRGLVKTAQSHQIPLVLKGSGESEPSFAQKLLGDSTHFRRKRLSLVLGFSMEMIRNPFYLLNPNCLIGLAEEFFHRFFYRANRDFKTTSIFAFIEWNEQDILSLIQGELNWKKSSHSSSSWRSDCKISELKNYLYRETLGFTKHDELLSTMIRRNLITRGDALTRLKHDNVISQQFLAEFVDELGLNFSDLDAALQEYKRVWPQRSLPASRV